MKFLAVVIALVMFRAGTAVHAVQQDGWFERWQRRVAGWQLVPWMGLGVVIAVPVLIAIGVLDTLDDILFGLPWIFAAVVLVLYAFGRGDLEQLQARYRMQSQSGDFEAAMLGFLPEPDANNPPMSARDVHRAVQQVLFYEAFQRWFAVLFYFVIAGPAAALAYRLVQLSRGSFEAALVERVLFLLDWVPARLLAATFSLAGDFVRCRTVLMDAVLDPGMPADELIYEVGSLASVPAAAQPDKEFSSSVASSEHDEGAELITRSGVVWIAALALLVILD